MKCKSCINVLYFLLIDIYKDKRWPTCIGTLGILFYLGSKISTFRIGGSGERFLIKAAYNHRKWQVTQWRMTNNSESYIFFYLVSNSYHTKTKKNKYAHHLSHFSLNLTHQYVIQMGWVIIEFI